MTKSALIVRTAPVVLLLTATAPLKSPIAMAALDHRSEQACRDLLSQSKDFRDKAERNRAFVIGSAAHVAGFTLLYWISTLINHPLETIVLHVGEQDHSAALVIEIELEADTFESSAAGGEPVRPQEYEPLAVTPPALPVPADLSSQRTLVDAKNVFSNMAQERRAAAAPQPVSIQAVKLPMPTPIRSIRRGIGITGNSLRGEIEALALAPGSYEPLDLVLALDTTGSMTHVLSSVKAQMQRIIAVLHRAEDLGRPVRVALIFFEDPTVRIASGLSSDFNAIRSEISTAHHTMFDPHNPTFPEASLDAVQTALKDLDWRVDAQAVILVLHDQPHRSHTADGTARESLERQLREHNPPISVQSLRR